MVHGTFFLSFADSTIRNQKVHILKRFLKKTCVKYILKNRLQKSLFRGDKTCVQRKFINLTSSSKKNSAVKKLFESANESQKKKFSK